MGWIELKWLRTCSGAGFCKHGHEHVSHNRQGMCRPAERLLASELGLCPKAYYDFRMVVTMVGYFTARYQLLRYLASVRILLESRFVLICLDFRPMKMLFALCFCSV